MTNNSQKQTWKGRAYKMHYEGDKSKFDTLLCVWEGNGEKITVPYKLVRDIAGLYRLPHEIREDIFIWAAMLHNPD